MKAYVGPTILAQHLRGRRKEVKEAPVSAGAEISMQKSNRVLRKG